MADNENRESWLELFDVEKKQIITKARLADIRFISRIGEHIFIPLSRARELGFLYGNRY
jgi:hypothetical protein